MCSGELCALSSTVSNIVLMSHVVTVFRKRSLEEYDDDYKPLSKRMHSMYLKDGPISGDNHHLLGSNVYGHGVSFFYFERFCVHL